MEADITLEQGHHGEIGTPGIIDSGAMGPCIAIGVFDKVKHYGYMIHESNAFYHDDVAKFLDHVLKKSRKRNLIIAVAGGQVNPHEEDDCEVLECRDFVIAELHKRFSDNQLSINWNNSTATINLILNTETGEFCIETWWDSTEEPECVSIEFD